MQPDSQFALSVDQLGFHYGSTPVLRDISFQVSPGEVCGLLGPNGSGKTTLFKCCMRFLPLHSGSVQLFGQSIATRSPAEMARLVAYVPQEHRQPFPFRVRDMVLMGRSPHMRSLFRLSAHDRQQVDSALERAGIAHLADALCNQLSGGQRQLVLIARALAQETPLLLLDEPTSALDFSNQMALWAIIRGIAQGGKTVVVCCHDPNHILWFCDRALVLQHGQMLANGQPNQIMTTKLLQTIYGPCCTKVPVFDQSIVCPIPVNPSPALSAAFAE